MGINNAKIFCMFVSQELPVTSQTPVQGMSVPTHSEVIRTVVCGGGWWWCTLISLNLRDLTGSVGLFTHGQVILLIEIYSLASETENNSL